MSYTHGAHGCSECHPTCRRPSRSLDERWQLDATPGYWGSSEPHTLVLGFSMGANQVRAYREDSFDKAGFHGLEMRRNVREILATLGLWDSTQDIDTAMSARARGFGFASLTRCSFSHLNPATGAYVTSGALMPKAPHDPWAREIMVRCAARYLRDIPPSVRRVVLFGTTDRYVQGVHAIMRTVFPDYAWVNDMAFSAGGRIWVFAVHPSYANRVQEWIHAPAQSRPGRKRALALQALGQFVGAPVESKPSRIGVKVLVKRQAPAAEVA